MARSDIIDDNDDDKINVRFLVKRSELSMEAMDFFWNLLL